MSNKTRRIGVFTDNKDFNDHITALRKYGYDIRVVTSGDQLKDFTSVFIDFSCKGELGYKLLDRIISISSHEEINIIAIVKDILGLDKITRQQDIRINDYVSVDISVGDLILKLKNAVSPETKLRKTFKGNKIYATTKGDITHITESGAIISTPVSFRKNTRIEIFSELIDDIVKVEQPIFKTSKTFPQTRGLFYSEVDFLNLSSSCRQRLRKIILNWALK